MTGPGWNRPRPPGTEPPTRAAVRSVHVTELARRGGRGGGDRDPGPTTTGGAALEGLDGRWQCTALEPRLTRRSGACGRSLLGKAWRPRRRRTRRPPRAGPRRGSHRPGAGCSSPRSDSTTEASSGKRASHSSASSRVAPHLRPTVSAPMKAKILGRPSRRGRPPTAGPARPRAWPAGAAVLSGVIAAGSPVARVAVAALELLPRAARARPCAARRRRGRRALVTTAAVGLG